MNRPWAIVEARSRDEVPKAALEGWFGLYKRSGWAGVIPNNLADAVLEESARQLFARGARMYIAVDPKMPSLWLGFLFVESTRDGVPVIHAAFTKPNYRRSGVQRSLFEAADIERTGRLFYTMKLGPESRFYPEGRYAPEIARRKAA